MNYEFMSVNGKRSVFLCESEAWVQYANVGYVLSCQGLRNQCGPSSFAEH